MAVPHSGVPAPAIPPRDATVDDLSANTVTTPSARFKGQPWHDVQAYGAIGDGTTDDTAAIQAAMTAAGANGSVYLPAGIYRTTATLTFVSGQRLIGQSGPQVQSGQSKIAYEGTGTALAPTTPAANTINVAIENLNIDAGASGTIAIDFTRVSYGVIRACTVIGATTATGILLDAVTSGQCYFNLLEQNKYIAGTGIKFTRGANVNQVLGGAFIGCGTGMHFESLSAGNTVVGCDMEDATTRHVYLDATANTFVGVHMEDAPIGYEITDSGGQNSLVNTTYASSVTTKVSEAAGVRDQLVHELRTGQNPAWSTGLWRMQGAWSSVSTPWELDPLPFSDTAISEFRLFKNVSTSGLRRLVLYNGDGTSTTRMILNAGTGDITTVGGKLIFGAAADQHVIAGTGSPEGVVTANPGSMYLNRSGGAGTTLYVKETLTGNTGWVAK